MSTKNAIIDDLLEVVISRNLEALVARVEIVVVCEGNVEAFQVDEVEIEAVVGGNLEAPNIEMLRKNNPTHIGNLEAPLKLS